jgi:hypothetical protein
MAEPWALGLIVPILARPWLDGITYPTDNFYFVWMVAILAATFAVKAWRDKLPLRAAMPLALLGGYWLLSLVFSVFSVQYDSTFRSLILWASYLLLFYVASNGIRSRTGFGIVMGAFVLTTLIETIYSFIHYQYVLPYVRDAVLQSPQILSDYFGTTDITPELAHRLNVNRAFGSLLFPNALAAFLIIGIPILAGYAWSAHIQYRNLPVSAPTRTNRTRALWAALATWLGGMVFWYIIWQFLVLFAFPWAEKFEHFGPFVNDGKQWMLIGRKYRNTWFLFMVLLPLLPVFPAWRAALRTGWSGLWIWLSSRVCGVLAVLEVIALWLTFSRGGFAGLLAGVGAIVAVLYFRTKHINRMAATAAAALLIGAALFAGHTAPAIAQDAPEAAAATAPAPQEQTADQPSTNLIQRDGLTLSPKDLSNPASFRLRITYWQTGITMAFANFFTGVGLGNFGVAYPQYQAVNAGDVKTAHNDFLQALCETGILGLLLFAGFWVCVLWRGAQMIRTEADPVRRGVLAGLFTGIMAFVLHALVDFNFFNPSLAFFAFLFAGLLFWRDDTDEKPSTGTHAWKVSVVVLLIAAATSFMGFQVFMTDFITSGTRWINVDSKRFVNERFSAAQSVLIELRKSLDKPATDRRYALIPIRQAVLLLPDRAALEQFGEIHVALPESKGAHRRLGSNEAIPPNAFLLVTAHEKALEAFSKAYEDHLKTLEDADSVYPHNPEMGSLLVKGYSFLSNMSMSQDERQRLAIAQFRWAEEALDRSPKQAFYHEQFAQACWTRGNLERGGGRTQYFDKGIEHYRIATTLYPVSASAWRFYGDSLVKYGEAIAKQKPEAGQKQIALGQEAIARAEQLAAQGRK